MKINSLAHNFRGLDFNASLSQRVIVTGSNFTGKSTLLDAISACLGGYTRHGKSAAKMEALIGKTGKATATLGLNNGAERNFSLTRTPGGSVTCKKEKVPLSCIAFDSSLFLAAKHADRIAMIQDAVGIKGNVIDLLKKAGSGLLPALFSKSADLGEWLTETQDNIAAAIKEEKQAKDRHEKTLQSLLGEDGVDFDDAAYHAIMQALNAHLIAKGAAEQMISHHTAVLSRIAGSPEPEKPLRDYDTVSALLNAAIKCRDAIRKAAAAAINAQMARDKLAEQIDHAAVCQTCGAESAFWSPEKGQALEQRIATAGQRLTEYDSIINSGPSEEEDTEACNNIKALDEELEIVIAHDKWSQSQLDRVYSTQQLDNAEAVLKVEAAEITAATAKSAELKAQRDLWIASQERQRQRQQAEQAKDESVADLDKLTAAATRIKAEANAQSAKLMKPILDTANALLQFILRSPLESHNFGLGRVQDGVWVPLEHFSGCEAAATTAAIQAALLTATDVRVCIVDEIARFDESTLDQFIDNLDTAIKNGLLEQAILVGVRIDSVPQGWQVITLK